MDFNLTIFVGFSEIKNFEIYFYNITNIFQYKPLTCSLEF